jgi:hypothetical protein
MRRIITRLIITGLLGLTLTGCLRAAAELIDAGAGCLRTERCWR